MLYRLIVALSVLTARSEAAFSTCGELRDAYLGAECCSAADDTAVPFGDASPPLALSSPPPLALGIPPPSVSMPSPPAFPVPTNYTGCDITIAGGGAGGLYSAYRLVKDAGVDGTSICIFEADTRFGGRIWSIREQGPLRDTVIDVGGYRTFDTISPRTQYLIQERLGLTLGCYDPISCLGKVIVDVDGNRIGYVTFLESMLNEITDLGVRFFLNHPVEKMEKVGDSTMVYLSGMPFGILAYRVILTVPQYPLQQILRNSPGLSVSDDIHRAIHATQPVYAVKFYLYYTDAWWLTQLGLEEGGFVAEGNAVSPPLEGRYHDGDIKCNAERTECHGWLQTDYFWDFSGAGQNYFARFQKSRGSAVTYMSGIADGNVALADVHAKVLAYHNLTVGDVVAPTEGILATWNLATPWANSGWHYWTDADKVPTLTTFLADQKIHLANEAFSATPSWAEGAILMVDDLIQELFGIPPPHSPVEYLARNYISEVWVDAPVSGGYAPICENTCIRDGSPFPTFAENGACNDGGEGSSVTAVCDFGTDCADCGPRDPMDAPGSDLAADPACFLGSSKLLLADGSRIPLSNAKKGMQVKSTLGVGTITEVLKHPIHDNVRRFRMPTEHGFLIGTLDHPVYVNGKWVEAGEARRAGAMPKMQIETDVVDYFWNLEIDGDAAEGESHHAYDVNGLTVSGLGDNARLNALYQRQNAFKSAQPVVKAKPIGLSDAVLEARGMTSGAGSIRRSASPVLDLTSPEHADKRCKAWDFVADGSQTCGSKVQWWINAYRYTPERAMDSVARRYSACASCRSTEAGYPLPVQSLRLGSVLSEDLPSFKPPTRRRMQSDTCTLGSLCPTQAPPSAAPAPSPSIIDGGDGEGEECDDFLCGDDDDDGSDGGGSGGDFEDECDEYLCGDDEVEDPCDEELCGPSDPTMSSPPSASTNLPPASPGLVEVDGESERSTSLLVPVLVPFLIAAVVALGVIAYYFVYKGGAGGSVAVKSAPVTKPGAEIQPADAPGTSTGHADAGTRVAAV